MKASYRSVAFLAILATPCLAVDDNLSGPELVAKLEEVRAIYDELGQRIARRIRNEDGSKPTEQSSHREAHECSRLSFIVYEVAARSFSTHREASRKADWEFASCIRSRGFVLR